MQKVLTAAQMREVDRLTTERYGIPSLLLMENAAHAVARAITERLGGSVKGRRILILCGKGNNGGDGAALARILWNQGASCFVDLIGSVTETNGDARVNFDSVLAVSGSPQTNGPNDNCLFISEIAEENRTSFFVDWRSRHMCVLVDALFGTGLTRSLEGSLAEIVAAVGQAKRRRIFEKIFAIDLPSGLETDSGEPVGPHTDVDVTITFTSPKAANILPSASTFNGELVVANIGSPEELVDEQPSQLFLLEVGDAQQWLVKTGFTSSSHKNKRGHALIIAGSDDYSGAAVLAGNAAIRSGVGLVTLACPAIAKAEIASRLLPEVILSTIESDEFGGHLERADAVAVGCGLDATDAAVEKVVREMVETRTKPVIVDAGALSFFSSAADLLQKPARSKGTAEEADGGTYSVRASATVPLILTPHEGEFLRLLGTDDKDAIQDRVAAVREFSQTNNVILVLKGERVLIGHPDGRVVVNPTGNSGLGKAGNGDTLTGILAGFVAQAVKMDIDIFETVVAAVYVAGMAGDVAEKKYGKRVMTASDVRECLVEVFDTLCGDGR